MRLSCQSMTANAVRLQLHALAYDMANLFCTLVLPDEVERWSLTTLREKVVKIGANASPGRPCSMMQRSQTGAVIAGL